MECKRKALSQEVVTVRGNLRLGTSQPTDSEKNPEQMRIDRLSFLAKAVGIAVALVEIIVVLALIVPFIACMPNGLVWHIRR